MLRFSKGYCSHIFIHFQPNTIESMVIGVGGYRLLLLWQPVKLKKVWQFDILALLDYVSTAHEIEIPPSLLHGVLKNFSCGFPWAICPDVFCFSLFSLKWTPMGATISKSYSSYKSQPKVFQTFPECSS